VIYNKKINCGDSAMSDDFVTIIPEQYDFIPDLERHQRGVEYFRIIAPQADEVEVRVYEDIVFVDCGSNFESIQCPSCHATLTTEVWNDWIEMDYKDKRWILNLHKMPCCGTNHTLHELSYSFPQGFARFELRALNPNIGFLNPDQTGRFAEILGCPVRAIYQHY
jgi:NAD-dependent SIR2 family protein deacetylase